MTELKSPDCQPDMAGTIPHRTHAHWRVEHLRRGARPFPVAWFVRRSQAEEYALDRNVALPAYNDPPERQYVVALEHPEFQL